MSLYPTKNALGRYDNVKFEQAAGHVLPTVKVSYLRRDVLLFVSIYIAKELAILRIELRRPL